MGKCIKILALSDIEVSFINNPVAALRFKDVGMVIGCGDLPYIYLEHIVNLLGVRAYFVRGNHARPVEVRLGVERSMPWGVKDLHGQVARDPSGLLLAGIEGSIRYNKGDYQYSQEEMWWIALRLAPRLMINKIQYGRYLDILVTHAPAWGIHDGSDHAHQGIKAFRWLNKVFQPLIHFHGHVHVINPLTPTATRFHETNVFNVFKYRELEVKFEQPGAGPELLV